MEIYSFLRAFADSWMLLFMALLFIGVVIFAFRPGARKAQAEAATSIFRNDTRPARSDAKANIGHQFKEASK